MHLFIYIYIKIGRWIYMYICMTAAFLRRFARRAPSNSGVFAIFRTRFPPNQCVFTTLRRKSPPKCGVCATDRDARGPVRPPAAAILHVSLNESPRGSVLCRHAHASFSAGRVPLPLSLLCLYRSRFLVFHVILLPAFPDHSHSRCSWNDVGLILPIPQPSPSTLHPNLQLMKWIASSTTPSHSFLS